MTQSETQMARPRKPHLGLAERPSAPCRAEAQALLSLADSLENANPKLANAFKHWRQQLNEMLAGPMNDDQTTEWRLEQLALDFRREWITLTSTIIAGALKSPPSDHVSILPISTSSNYFYERVIHPVQEKKLKDNTPEVAGWASEFALFSSGMAAITAAITVLRHKKNQYKRDDGKALQLDMFGGYFETIMLFELLDPTDLRCKSFRDEAVIFERFGTGETDILFLELIAYDWQQSVIDPAALLQALATRPRHRPWILMVDTTLLGPLFDAGALLVTLAEHKPLLMLEIRSGLKLEQVGLEFSNVGVIRVLSPETLDSKQYPDAKKFQQKLAFSRGKMGTSLSFSQVAILDAPWIFDPELTLQHTRAVMDNNRALAYALSGIEGIFAQVNHPALGAQKALAWAESPLVVMEFHAEEDNKDNWKFLLAIISHEARQRKLVLHRGASFGFRHHRCEIVEPDCYAKADRKQCGFFKVAMGARCGPSLDGTIALFQELAAFSSFENLRRAYPKINPKHESAVFPDLNAMRRFR
jgi:hypothetical protein